jgi:hypothetical protein
VAQKLEGILLNGNEDLPLSLFKNFGLPSLRLLQMIEMMPKFVKVLSNLGIVELALMLQHLMTMFKLQVWDCSSFC